MTSTHRRISYGLFVICITLLIVSSGVALAHGGESTSTTVTVTPYEEERTHHSNDGHHGEESTETTGTHHDAAETHRTNQSGHAHGNDTEAAAEGHHESNQGVSGHAHENHDEGGLLGGWISIIGGLFLVGAIMTAPAYRYVQSSESPTLAPIHFAGALLALFTAAVHLYLHFEHGTLVMLLAGLGFVGGVVLLFAGVARRYLYAAGIVYTLAQIVLWINAGMPHLGSFGLLDKIAQVSLIVVLGYLYVRAGSGVPR